MHFVSSDPDYGHAQNEAIQQKKDKTITIGVIGALVAVISAIVFVLLVKAGKRR